MQKVMEVLKFKDGGPSVDEARKAMFAAGEQPRGEGGSARSPLPLEIDNTLEPEFPPAIDEILAAPVPPVGPAVVAPVPPAPATPVPEPPKVPEPIKIDTPQFTGEIKQDGGRWVAEIRYKLGGDLSPGTERFVGTSKNDLMIKLLEGKGHATLRVKKAVRREKLGRDLDKSWPLPADMTAEEYKALPEKVQKSTLGLIERQQSYEFMSEHQDYHQTVENGKALIRFLNEQNLPVTAKNLEYAFEDLTESGLLEMAPAPPEKPAPAEPLPEPEAKPKPQDSAQPATAPQREDSPAPPTPLPAASPVVAAPPAPPAPLRKRGSSGLQPGQSSVPSTPVSPEDGSKPKELSEAEARKMPLPDLKRIAYEERARNRTPR